MKDADKLPKWAQYEIVKMERKIETLESLAEAHNTEDSNITYGYPKKHGLPEHTTVSFLVGNVRFDVQILNNVLKVYSTDVIAVIPNASNSVSIKSAEL